MFFAFHHLKLESAISFDLFFETYTKHNHALWESYRKKEVVKKDLTRLRFQNTFDELEIKGVDADEMNARYLNEMPNQKVLNEGVIDILDYLKKKGYHLNIITNGFSEVQRKKIETSGLKPYFDKIYISEEIKSPKPSKEIFEYAIKSSNAKKINSFMVGDDWDVDIIGALNFGIDAVHFNKTSPNSSKPKILSKNSNKTFSVERMSQLYTIL
jgi:putative hydrolase of the HAD superfamily